MTEHQIFDSSFACLYPLYLNKAERKGRSKDEVDEVITWLTGYDAAGLAQAVAGEVNLKTFLEDAPGFNPQAKLITGTVCGIRVEDIEDPLMQKLRYVDKRVDELARGKKMASILRGGVSAQPA